MTISVSVADAVDPLVLAIDLGTSSARTLIYDALGRPVETWEAHEPYSVDTTRDGGVTINPAFLLDLTARCVDAMVKAAEIASRSVAAVAVDTFWHSLIGVNAESIAVTPIYTWADTRSAADAVELRRRFEEGVVHERTGCGLHSSYWPAKLLWLARTDPVVTKRVVWWMSFGEYLYLHLFGNRRVSISMASGTGLLDQNTCTWDEDLVRGLPISEGQLSPLADFSDTMSSLRPSFAARWRMLRSVPWYLAVGDGACNNIGSGGVSQDWVVAMIGTSGALRVVHRADYARIPRGLWTYRVDRHTFVQGGALSAGGNLFAWLDQTLRLAPIDTLEHELSAMTADAHGLTVLPFLAGDRSPDWDPRARAAYVGMTLDTSGLDIVRASLEAVAYRFALIYGILKQVIGEPTGIIASGAGLIRSPAWMQIMSDVLGEPVFASAVPEATSRGAALLVLKSMGIIHNFQSLRPPLGTEYAPDPQQTEIYAAARDRQRQLYQQLVDTSGQMPELEREGKP